ncbi:MAG: NADH-quinone oxidoreductase subunit L, partial [Oceanospirillaceae bacterium]|nr:NADH-quinone oxidoreductase subunit L [Oceanospirillaceae bacterium]
TGNLPEVLRVQWFSAADLWVSALFLLLFSLFWLLRYRAHWPLVQRLSLALFAGLYLDEWFTRITLRLWPARLPVRANPKQLAPHQGSKHVLAAGRKEQLL